MREPVEKKSAHIAINEFFTWRKLKQISSECEDPKKEKNNSQMFRIFTQIRWRMEVYNPSFTLFSLPSDF